MVRDRRSDELLTHFGLKQKERKEPRKKPTQSSLHPAVRRRRLIWLIIMICFICWTIVELTIQQQRIWAKEKELVEKQQELKQVMAEIDVLKEEIKQLHNEDYLLELAHKMGYSKPGEEVYTIQNEE